MTDGADHLLERARTNRARKAELAAAIDRDIAALVETHGMSARRVARELDFGSDHTVRLAVRRHHDRQQRATRTAAASAPNQ